MTNNVIKDYSISDIINYRSLSKSETNDFYFLSEIPSIYEPFSINPDYYGCGLITHGSLKIEIDEKAYNLTPNTLMIHRPKEIFKIIDIKPHTKGAFVFFTKEFINTFCDNIFTVKNKSFLTYGVDMFFELSNKDRDSLLNVFKTIFFLLEKPFDDHWESMAKNLTSALIFQTEYILKNYIDSETIHISKDEMYFRLFKNLMFQYFTKERKLKFYSDKLYINHNQLGIIIKRVSGKSPRNMINALLLNEAKRLLKTTNDTVGIIADSLNYSDIYTFSKFFKRNTGYSPSHYRAKYHL